VGSLFHLINGLHAGWWDALMLGMTWLGDHDRFVLYVATMLVVACTRPHQLPQHAVAVFAPIGAGSVAVASAGLRLLHGQPTAERPR